MSPEIVGVICIISLFALIFLGIPIAYALAFVGFVGYVSIGGFEAALRTMGMVPYSEIASYSFTVIPLFMIMGHFAFYAGIPSQLFDTARKWVGHLPGGLVQATIAGSTALGAACGSGIASCSIVSKVTIPDMIRNQVKPPLAYGAVAAAGTIAQMIPPSTLMVIYGIISEQSVAKLLIAGILPGIMIGITYMTMVYIRVKRDPSLAPISAKPAPWRERFISLKNLWGLIVIMIVIMGGIWSGILTPTESGGIGAMAAFILALRKIKLHGIYESILETIKSSSMIFLIIACAFIFGYVISISRLPSGIAEFLSGTNRWVLLFGIVALYIILGFFLDMIAAMYITLPIILPAMHAAGFDLIWFGVLMVHLCELALITPPYGLNLFVLKGVIPNSKMSDIISGIWPFVVTDIINLALFIAFPQIALWLPSMMK